MSKRFILSPVTLKAVWKNSSKKAYHKRKETRGEKIQQELSIMLGLVIIIGLIFHPYWFVEVVL